MSRYRVGILIILAAAATGIGATATHATTPVMLAWLLFFGLATLLLRCPTCRFPLFRRGPVWTPWPSRLCRCGQRLDT